MATRHRRRNVCRRVTPRPKLRGAAGAANTDGCDVRLDRAFTLIELLVVVAIVVLLIGLLLPALAIARRSARVIGCASNLQQLGVGMALYLNDYSNTLPQDGSGIAARFGGRSGWLPEPDMTPGADVRPLNRYVSAKPLHEDDDVFLFRCPLDRGLNSPLLPIDLMYEAIGTSYNLNDHDLTGEDAWTLIPLNGGRMPYVADPSKTWVLADVPVYNYQDGYNLYQYWHHPDRVEVNMLMLDGHVEGSVVMTEDRALWTSRYTFWPVPDWDELRSRMP